ncbi:MAG: nucleotidyltransferase family protein [Bacteroidota bacterium]
MKTSALVLAAGEAKRMGEPKQLLPYKGQPLIMHTVKALQTLPLYSLHVVLGAYFEQIHPILDEARIPWIFNPDWQEGMGTSIRAGMQQLPPDTDQVMICLADQVHISGGILSKLLALHQTASSPLTASVYGETIGVPAIFSQAFFPNLRELGGAQGARAILRKYQDQLNRFPWEKGVQDIDTPEDYRQLLSDDQ